MLSPDLHALGFDAPTWDDLLQTSLDKYDRGISDVGGWEFITPYTDSSGARLQRFYRDGWQTTTSFVTTHSRWSANIGMINELVALVDLLHPDGSISHRTTVSMDDPFNYPELAGPQDTEHEMVSMEGLQLAALAVEVSVFPNVESWREHRSIKPRTVQTPDGTFSMFDRPQILLSPWTFDYFGGGNAADVGAFNKLTLEVEAVETRRNELTGKYFWVASGRLQENLPPLEVILAEESSSVIAVGSVIEGTVVLVGSSGMWDEMSEE